MEPSFSTVMFILLIVAAIHYLSYVARERLMPQLIADPGASLQREGFTDGAKDQKETFLKGDEVYDDFYASVYDQLTSNQKMSAAKVAFALGEWNKAGDNAESMIVLDAGAGTGLASIEFVKAGAPRVIALDKSAAMLKRAREVNLANSKLNETEKNKIDFRQADLMNPSALSGSEVSHAVALYFTIYYVNDLDAFFRHMFLWVKPGGKLMVEMVNKYKFDPMFEAASPWAGFSVQKYAKERITESQITFDKFKYVGKFDLIDPKAEFRETFYFKEGGVRRQKHEFTMPNISEVVKIAQAAGWVYTKYIDLTIMGFEYAFLLNFRHP